MLAAILMAVAVWFGVHTIYPLAMAAKRAYEDGRLTPYWVVMLAPAIVLGLVLDFVFQFTFGWAMFLETPFRGGALFSGRVKHHFRNSSGWRNRLAVFFARNLNVFDPTHITPPKG
jgi:cell shape-determining protein MreD